MESTQWKFQERDEIVEGNNTYINNLILLIVNATIKGIIFKHDIIYGVA